MGRGILALCKREQHENIACLCLKLLNIKHTLFELFFRQEEDDETDSDEDDDEGDKQISSLLDAEEEGGEDRRAITYQVCFSILPTFFSS